MSEKAQKPKVKDLDPKAAAQHVMGGCPCCIPSDPLTHRTLEQARNLTPDISPPR